CQTSGKYESAWHKRLYNGLGRDAGAVKRRARRFQQQEISVADRGLETGDCDLRQRPGMGQGAAAAGRTHVCAGEIARRRIKVGRLRDERNQERLIRDEGIGFPRSKVKPGGERVLIKILAEPGTKIIGNTNYIKR